MGEDLGKLIKINLEEEKCSTVAKKMFNQWNKEGDALVFQWVFLEHLLYTSVEDTDTIPVLEELPA